MGYWLVMAIVALAIVAVMIALGSEEAGPTALERPKGKRFVWVALGSSGLSPGAHEDESQTSWVDLVRAALDQGAITYDFTQAGSTATEAQRNQLEAAVATGPDVVSLFIGPDDFRDAEDLNTFERRLWHILSTLRAAGATAVMPNLPALSKLPSLAAEEDQESLAEELTSWNAAIARLVAAADGHLVDLAAVGGEEGGTLFTEHAGRFILTDAGQRWFAALMEEPVKQLTGLEEGPAEPHAAPDGSNERME
jgi:hypothetical protein